MTNIEIIKAACAKANPEIIVNKNAQLIHLDHSVTYFEEYRKIGLADVLLAIDSSSFDKTVLEYSVNSTGMIESRNRRQGMIKVHVHWNLRTSLEDQSEETLQFLADLLH